MTDLNAVKFVIDGGVARLRLNRPEARNAFHQQVGDELLEVATRCAGDPSLRALMITGNGPMFSVGGDVAVFGDAPRDAMPDTLTRMAIPYHEALRQFARLQAPIVTAVHGGCAGAGLGLVFVADVGLAASGTKFATGFGAIGISCDSASSWYLPRLVGIRRAAELLIENRVIDAAEAAGWGLISRVVSRDELADVAESTVRKLAGGPTCSFAETRALMHDSWSSTLNAQLEAETESLRRTAATADASGAVASFLAKRSPVFNGM